MRAGLRCRGRQATRAGSRGWKVHDGETLLQQTQTRVMKTPGTNEDGGQRARMEEAI